MSRLPNISIITPSYNQGRFIERTVRSVLDQGYPNLEYIVMDGGSQDGTLDVLRRYEGRLTWVSEQDRGQADAINKGIRRTSGDIVAYLNSDDVYRPGALLRVAEEFDRHREALWLTGKCAIIDEEDREVRRPITAYKNLLLRRYSYSLLLVTNPVSQPATFWRRSAVEQFGLFNEDEHLVMDYDFWLRIGKENPPVVLDDYLADFRVYAASKTSRSFLTTFEREMVLAREHSDSALLNFLHRLSYLGISAAYLLLNAAGRKRKAP